MGFGLWIDVDERVAWALGTHEYRPLGAAVIAVTDQFRPRDFQRSRRLPPVLRSSFAGFFGSLEEVNQHLHRYSHGMQAPLLRITPSHVR